MKLIKLIGNYQLITIKFRDNKIQLDKEFLFKSSLTLYQSKN